MKTSAPVSASSAAPVRPRGFVSPAYPALTAESPGRPAVHDALAVAADHVRDSGGEQHLRHCDAGRADAGDDDPEVLDPLADDLERVDERSQDDDRRAVLVVVEDRDVELLCAAGPRSRSSAAPRCPRG